MLAVNEVNKVDDEDSVNESGQITVRLEYLAHYKRFAHFARYELYDNSPCVRKKDANDLFFLMHMLYSGRQLNARLGGEIFAGIDTEIMSMIEPHYSLSTSPCSKA